MVGQWLDISDLDSPSDAYSEYAVDSASYILWALSGRKYSGLSQITEQYVCPGTDLPAGCSWHDNNSYTNQSAKCWGYTASHSVEPTPQGTGVRFRLRQHPVAKIVEVSIGGNVLPSGSYYIRNNSDLVIDTDFCSSLCDGPVVTYKYGVPPPYAGKLAAIELANEFLLSINGDNACSLPERVSSISRQGLSIQVFDPQDFLDKGRVGLIKVDMFLAATNPYNSKKPAKVFSPDLPRGIHRKH